MTSADHPIADTDSEPWWAAIQSGNLTVNACRVCHRNSLYARPFCPHCWSDQVGLVPASGDARLYTWSVVHQNAAPFGSRVPYIVAMVDLVEGPRLMTNLADCAPEALAAGLELTLDFRHDENGLTVPVFKPAAPAPERK